MVKKLNLTAGLIFMIGIALLAFIGGNQYKTETLYGMIVVTSLYAISAVINYKDLKKK